jgi:hypothetical protein
MNKNKKDIKDYLHLYLDCEAMYGGYGDPERLVKIIGASLKDGVQFQFADNGEVDVDKAHEWFKPILRPLSDMTEKEAKELYKVSPYSKGEWLINSVVVKENIKGFEPNIVKINWSGQQGATGYGAGTEYLYFNKLEAEQHRWLLNKGFDIFELIPAGLAIDKTKQTLNIYG